MSGRSGESRKRKRSPPSNNDGTTIELPRIRYVPTVAVPPFLEALRVTTKFFQKLEVPSMYTIDDWEKRNDNNGSMTRTTISNNNSNSSVHDTLMDRMDVAAAAANSSSSTAEAIAAANGRKKNMIKAVESWMADVKDFARRTSQSSTNKERDNLNNNNATRTSTTSENGNTQEEKERPSIPYAFFLYLWGMQQEHNRVAVRRSALFLSSLLLQKSRDCRYHLEQETNLATWISNIVASKVIWKNPEKSTKELPLLHREAYALLSYLIDKGYSDMYPKIGVALKSLRHQCPHLEVSEVSDVTSIAEYRRLRDLALRYGQEELEHVEKLLRRADECLEILVPRVGTQENNLDSSTANTTESQTARDKSNKNIDDNEAISGDGGSDDDDDDESDIEWEDGDEESITGHDESHISAVERTILAMEASATTVLRGGELEIDFDQNAEDVQVDTAVDQAQKATILKKLRKCIQRLSNPHFIRMNAWLNGLRNADSLVLQPGSASLVTLSSEQATLRALLIEQFTQSKQEVSRIISSASRLNVEAPKTESRQSSIPPRPIALGMGERDVKLDRLIRQQKQKTRKTSHSKRIQIKCKSR